MAKLPLGVSKAVADASSALKRQRQKKKEEALLKKVGRKLKELYYGPKTYLPKGRKLKPTIRTKFIVEKGLKPAGLTEKEIARLRGERK